MTKKEILEIIDRDYGGDIQAMYSEHKDKDSFIAKYKNGGRPKRSKGTEVDFSDMGLDKVDVRRGGKLEDRYYTDDDGYNYIESTKYKTDRQGNQGDKKKVIQSLVGHTDEEGYTTQMTPGKGIPKYIASMAGGIAGSGGIRKGLMDYALKNNPVPGLVTTPQGMKSVDAVSYEDEKSADITGLIGGAAIGAAGLAASAYRDKRRPAAAKGYTQYKAKYEDGGNLPSYQNGTFVNPLMQQSQQGQLGGTNAFNAGINPYDEYTKQMYAQNNAGLSSIEIDPTYNFGDNTGNKVLQGIEISGQLGEGIVGALPTAKNGGKFKNGRPIPEYNNGTFGGAGLGAGGGQFQSGILNADYTSSPNAMGIQGGAGGTGATAAGIAGGLLPVAGSLAPAVGNIGMKESGLKSRRAQTASGAMRGAAAGSWALNPALLTATGGLSALVPVATGIGGGIAGNLAGKSDLEEEERADAAALAETTKLRKEFVDQTGQLRDANFNADLMGVGGKAYNPTSVYKEVYGAKNGGKIPKYLNGTSKEPEFAIDDDEVLHTPGGVYRAKSNSNGAVTDDILTATADNGTPIVVEGGRLEKISSLGNGGKIGDIEVSSDNKETLISWSEEEAKKYFNV